MNSHVVLGSLRQIAEKLGGCADRDVIEGCLELIRAVKAERKKEFDRKELWELGQLESAFEEQLLRLRR